MAGFSDRLKEERKRLGLSQADMAEAGGVSLNSQSNYENGHRSPDAVYLERLVSLGVDTGFLLLGIRSPVNSTAARVEEPISRHPRNAGWQSVDGPVLGWISYELAEQPGFERLVKRSQALGVEWHTAVKGSPRLTPGSSVVADFALLANPGKRADSEVERLKQFAESLHGGAYGISLSQFEHVLDDLKEHGSSIRNALWRKFLGVPPLEPGAVFLVSVVVDLGAEPEKRLLRVERIIAGVGANEQWLGGHWEKTGEVAEVSIARIDGSMVHVATSESFVPSQLAERFRAHEANRRLSREPRGEVSGAAGADGMIMRAVTREEAALLDNYEAADERGRAAARSVLDALAQPKAANG